MHKENEENGELSDGEICDTGGGAATDGDVAELQRVLKELTVVDGESNKLPVDREMEDAIMASSAGVWIERWGYVKLDAIMASQSSHSLAAGCWRLASSLCRTPLRRSAWQ